MPRIVIGGGPCGVRTAAALGAEGLLLDPAAEPAGWQDPRIPEDQGLLYLEPTDIAVVEAAYGAAPDVAEWERAISVGGQLSPLPLSPVRLRRVLPRGDHLVTLQDQARARARVWMRSLVGGGLEMRTYQDWVVQQFGQKTFEALHGPYARKRWGEPSLLNVSMARVHHVEQGPGGRVVALGASPAQGWAHLVGQIGKFVGEQFVTGLRLEDGQVRSVQTEDSEWEVEGPLFCVRSAAEVLAWLGDAVPESLRWDVARLPTRHRIQVALQAFQGVGVAGRLPAEIHVIDGELPLFRITSPNRLPGDELSPGTLVAHLSVGPSSALWNLPDRALAERVSVAMSSAGVPATDPETATVVRLRHHDPGWLGPWHPAHGRVVAALEALGIHLVGRAGAYRWMNPVQEWKLVRALAGEGAAPCWELYRTLCDPPILSGDEAHRLDPFVTG